MKTLIVFYSRTGITKKLALKLKELISDCDIEEIESVKDRSGAIGYLMSGKEAMQEKLAEIKDIKNDPSNYDLIIIGTPVWAFNIASPIRTYIANNKNKFKNVAMFLTQGGSGSLKAIDKTEKLLSGKKLFANLELLTKEVVKNTDQENIEKFVEEIRRLVD